MKVIVKVVALGKQDEFYNQSYRFKGIEFELLGARVTVSPLWTSVDLAPHCEAAKKEFSPLRIGLYNAKVQVIKTI